MRDAGLIEFRRHDPDVVGQRSRNFLDNLQAGGMNAVVVGAENSHRLNALFARFRDGRRAVLSGYRQLGKPGNACQKGILAATFSGLPVLHSPYVGGLSSPASHPRAPEVMGSSEATGGL